MPRKNAPVEVNKFVKGLITEASPLTFPDNASIQETNMVLLRDGSRRRRLGMDIEDSGTSFTTAITPSAAEVLSSTTFRWENAGGDPDKSLVAVQTGNELNIFDLDAVPLSSGHLLTHTLSVGTSDTTYSFAAVDGVMVVASGVKEVDVFEYDDDTGTVSNSQSTLKVRDLFGIDAFNPSGDNLTEGSNIEVRPFGLIDNRHIYNLRNQTWAVPRYRGNDETIADCINSFQIAHSDLTPPLSTFLPSNADDVTSVLYADSGDAGNRTAERFFPEDLIVNPPGSLPAPSGYFIIDAMERGTSRREQVDAMHDRYPVLTRTVTGLLTDKTPGGASVISEFAGHVFFSGFSGEIIDGDSHSPRMSSYVLFSPLVRSLSDITKCYQIGDPTNKENPDIVDTDGGFIRIDGAYGIHSLTNVGPSLIITAKNGVWRLYGGSEGGFKATNFIVEKISDHGSQGPRSVVRVGNSLLYWGDDGIYTAEPDQFGSWAVKSLSQNTIQTYYDNITSESKINAKGVYDSFERKVRWIYDIDLNDVLETKELVFDVNLAAFYINEIRDLDATNLPKVIDIFEVNPYQLVLNQFNIVDGVDNVVDGVDNIVATIGTRTSVSRELNYLIVTSTFPTIEFAFGSYRVTDWYDWKGVDSIGVDADAAMITGYLSGGDFQRGKQLNYLTVHLRQTETGFIDDGSGNISSTPQSSCLVQVQWNWSNSATSGKWSREFQAYRLRRHFIPDNASSLFDNGNTTVNTRNKVRGSGRVISIQFKTEPGKNLHLDGWSMVIGVNSNV